MSDFLTAVVRMAVKVVLFIMALIFVASLLVAAMLLAAFWGLRVLWSKITGKPLKPWGFSFNPRTNWDRFYGAAGNWKQGRGTTYDGESRNPDAPRPDTGASHHTRREPLIIDVEPSQSKQ